MIDRGKTFENIFRSAVEEAKERGYQVDIQRLFDVIGKKTIEQPSDFICYHKPNQIYVECKSTNKNYFSFYEQRQYTRLLEKSKIDGVIAGMLVWFVQEKRVFWLDIKFLNGFYIGTGLKSISIKRLDGLLSDDVCGVYEIEQKTTRVKPKMNIEKFFNDIVRY